MVPVNGSCSFEEAVNVNIETLKLFNLDLNSDIVGATSCKNCKKWRLIHIIHVTCLAHGIQ